MHPVTLPGTEPNLKITLLGSEDNPDPEMYGTYPAFHQRNKHGVNHVFTWWQPSKEDIESINRGEPIYLVQLCGAEEKMVINPIRLYTRNNI